MDLLLEHTGKGFITMLLISMPAVLAAAAIGLVVGILQAVTQVQEQTIAAAPKVLGVFIIIMVMGSFSTKTLTEYFKKATNIAFQVIPRDEETVLSGEEFYKYKQKTRDKYHYSEKMPEAGDIMKNPGKIPFTDQKYKESVKNTPKGPVSRPNFIEKQKINSGGR